jgi:hypothetical protein
MRRSAVLAATLLLVPAVAFGGFRVSSFKKETRTGANSWNAASALDGKMETCWQTDPEQENAGAWFEVDLPRGEVDKVAMVIGWDKDEQTFKDYPRVKTVRVEVFGNESDENARLVEQTYSFEDKRGWQSFDLPDTKVGGEMNGGKVKITVVDVYEGSDYPNLAVSEVLVHLKEQDVSAGSVKYKVPPANSADGKTGDEMLDGNVKTVWAAKGPTTEFDIRAEGFGVSSIGIVPGPAGSARPKTVEITTNDITTSHVLADKPGEAQWVLLPAVVGYTGSAWGAIKVKVVDTYPGKTDQNVAIADVKMKYTNFEGL